MNNVQIVFEFWRRFFYFATWKWTVIWCDKSEVVLRFQNYYRQNTQIQFRWPRYLFLYSFYKGKHGICIKLNDWFQIPIIWRAKKKMGKKPLDICMTHSQYAVRNPYSNSTAMFFFISQQSKFERTDSSLSTRFYCKFKCVSRFICFTWNTTYQNHLFFFLLLYYYYEKPERMATEYNIRLVGLFKFEIVMQYIFRMSQSMMGFVCWCLCWNEIIRNKHDRVQWQTNKT